MRTLVWSSGGGVQSTAIAALIVRGELSPELSVIVDTGYENKSTWLYLNEWIIPALEAEGCQLHRVQKDDYASVGLYRNKDILIPAFTTRTGGVGKLPTYCSNEWKQRVMRRWVCENSRSKQFDVMIGFTIDELWRVKTVMGKWQNIYPLIERRMTRSDCLALVKQMSWPMPPRSSCWMCPNKSDSEWKVLKKTSDWQKAVNFEREIQRQDEDLFLHGSGVSLSEADLNESQNDLFTRCTNGMCFV